MDRGQQELEEDEQEGAVARIQYRDDDEDNFFVDGPVRRHNMIVQPTHTKVEKFFNSMTLLSR